MEKFISSQVIDNVLVTQILVPQMRDATLAYQIKDQLVEMINQHAPRAIVLDLSRLEFIGSVGFLAFLAARRITNTNQIILCNMNERIHEVFAICRLVPPGDMNDTPFAVQPTVESALASISTAHR